MDSCRVSKAYTDGELNGGIKMDEKLLEALSQGAWGNYMTIHFLEWLSGERVITSPKDIGIEVSELPRLLEQAKCYESNCVAIRNEHLTTAST
jgi:hypothetical protein